MSAEILGLRLAEANQDIGGRRTERWGMVAAAAVGSGFVAFEASDPWASLLAPIGILFVAFAWLQTDRRIGMAANYKRKVVEPAMQLHDELMGYEEFLDKVSPDRAPGKMHLTAVITRLYFPTLQAGMWLRGAFLVAPHPQHRWALWATGLLTLGIIALTFAKVKHIRKN